MQERIASSCLFGFFSYHLIVLQRNGRKTKARCSTSYRRVDDRGRLPHPCVSCGRFQKPERWIENPQVSADAEDPLTVYAIDCEMVRSLTTCNSLK